MREDGPEDWDYWRPAGESTRSLADGSWLPDLDDPATLGCLLALVREAWREPTIHAEWFDVRWSVCASGDVMLETGGHRLAGERAYGWTEAEALVAALEAAPVRGSE